MSINLTDPHVRYTKIINFGEESKHVPYCDPISDTLSLNGWGVARSIDENGKIKINTYKTLDQFNKPF